MQKYTSAETSINLTRTPAIAKLVDWKPGTTNIDLGCGKKPELLIEYLATQGVTGVGIDPYNRTKLQNREARAKVRKADTVTISNVLNVIKEKKYRRELLETAKRLVKTTGKVYVTVYEGNKTGQGEATSKGWQENRATVDYVAELKKVFPDVKRVGKLLVCKHY